jgi:hypothetical protein
MRRFRVVLFVMLTLGQYLIAADQPSDTFRVSTSPLADVHQETLQAISAESKSAVEVFPGAYKSAIGATVMTRVEALMGRMDDADRDALAASKARAGFDRSIVSWRANATGRIAALAVRYYRQPLFELELEVTDDYGRADPVDPFRYEFFAIAVCSRNAEIWTCEEEAIADAAARLNVNLPQARAERIAAAARLVEMVLKNR